LLFLGGETLFVSVLNEYEKPFKMAAPAHEMPESKGCGNKSDNNKPGSFTTPAIEQQPQTLDGCGKPVADFPTDTAHTPDPSLKDMSQSLPGCGAPAKTSEEMIDETVMAASSDSKEDKTWTDKNGKVWQEGDLSGQDVKYPANIDHLFEKRDGHIPNTEENKKVIMDLVKDKANYLGDDRHGNWWYGKILPDGRQLWASAWGDVVGNCGLNETPKPYHPKTGLCNYNPSKRKK